VKGEDFNAVYVVYSAANQQNLFVGAAASYVTDPTAAAGDRTNPYPTISAALAAATAGDVIAVLPGLYTESITLKPFIKIESVATTSTDTTLNLGNALATVIRAPVSTSTTAYATVTATDLPSVTGVDTELAGFTIACPLVGNAAYGPIDPDGTGVLITDSNVLIDRDYIIDTNVGIDVVTSGTLAPTPRIWDDGVIGNVDGILLDDSATASALVQPIQVINNTIGFNTVGIQANNSAASLIQADIINNIIWQNHDLSTQRLGTGIFSQTINKLIVESNMFSGNGASDTNPADNTVNVGNGFNPANLKSTPDALGNFTGLPAFVFPRDPRPNGDGPGRFFVDANYDLTVKSAAIDAALESVAPSYDFLDRGRVRIPGRGFPGTGPADVGAFEYDGTAGTSVGGAFRIATTSLASGGAMLANGATFSVQNAPK
jgi:hypothetical protein